VVGIVVVVGYLLVFAAHPDRAARVAPADTAVYLNVYLQPSTGQKLNLFELVGRLPGFRDPATLEDKIHDVAQRLLGIRQRQQVVQIRAADAGPAQVIRNPRGLYPGRQRPDLANVVQIERRAAANRQRYAVHDERIVLANACQVVQRLATRYQVVLGDYLEPVDCRSFGQHGLVVIGTQA